MSISRRWFLIKAIPSSIATTVFSGCVYSEQNEAKFLANTHGEVNKSLLGDNMPTTPTQNPVPSEAPSDLKFNSGKMDEFVNSKNNFFTDRLGNFRLTLLGIESSAVSAGPAIEAAKEAAEQATKARVTAEQIVDNTEAYISSAKDNADKAKSHAESSKKQADRSESAALRSEAASLEAGLESKIFDSVSEGINGTSNGDYFRVWMPPSTGISMQLYKNNSGSPLFITDYPSQASVENISNDINSINNTFSYPNKWFDYDFSILSSMKEQSDMYGGNYTFNNVGIVKDNNNGSPFITISSIRDNTGYFTFYIRENDFNNFGLVKGEKATFGLRFTDSKGGMKTGNDSIIIQQYRSDGSEITDKRIEIKHPSPSTPFYKKELFTEIDISHDCSRFRIYFSVSSSSNRISIDNLMICNGVVDKYRPSFLKAIGLPGSSSSHEVFVSLSGDDSTGDGSKLKPFKTINSAISKISGVGKIYVSGGNRYNESINSKLIKDIEIIGSDSENHQRTVFYYGTKLGGISKVDGKNKTFKSRIALNGQPNFIWLDGINDTESRILPEHRHPLSNGREYRLWCTKIYSVKSTESINSAINEIEGASIPLCFYDKENGEMYFSIPTSVSIDSSSIYVSHDNNDGLISNKNDIWNASGKLSLRNIHIRYGSCDGRGIRKVSYNSCTSIGAPINGFDISWDDEFRLCESCGAGSSNVVNGDGFNASTKSDWTHYDCYAHDNNDDGISSHQNCVEVGYGVVSEFNGGAGLCPSYGAQVIYHNPLTIKNSVNTRSNIIKQGGITTIRSPRWEDDGICTDCTVYNGISIGDKNSFFDDSVNGTYSAYMTTYSCISIDPVIMGFSNYKAINCKHTGSGLSKNTATKVISVSDI